MRRSKVGSEEGGVEQKKKREIYAVTSDNSGSQHLHANVPHPVKRSSKCNELPNHPCQDGAS